MKPSVIIPIIIMVLLSLLSLSTVVSAKQATSHLFEPTISPSIESTLPIPTPTIDPSMIGDTTGVIVVGLIIVLVILIGVIWGGVAYQRESNKDNKP